MAQLENCLVCGSEQLNESDGALVCDVCGARNVIPKNPDDEPHVSSVASRLRRLARDAGRRF